jgi:hypothetical protein
MSDIKSPWPCSECGSVSWLAQAERTLIHERDLSEAAAEVERLRETLALLKEEGAVGFASLRWLRGREPWLWENDDDGT